MPLHVKQFDQGVKNAAYSLTRSAKERHHVVVAARIAQTIQYNTQGFDSKTTVTFGGHQNMGYAKAGIQLVHAKDIETKLEHAVSVGHVHKAKSCVWYDGTLDSTVQETK
ncbi:hypothetical protein H257_17601 [Aphanomyces astaci]|uniref:Uncharacterized protein n=1 Tax=Aphanomyces astaci TaxID=112090 RepID=W4FG24_APHAT|nr:hypothetical protein H257_17601 [Aphanomyces astaci]ETV65791.1 hypothetical protein H257_17601 [Aphanomyces astaci]|eukprot:XP_009844766.1 hypothetical protein H257_17601 [Aphanomyces astaci]